MLNKPIEVIENLTVEPSAVVELLGKTFIVKNGIKIEPNGELIIKDAALKFEKEAGIIGKDCSFIAENSTFEALNKEWKNITIGGNIKGHIKGCTFKGGRGRLGEEINNLLGLYLQGDRTNGGALFIYSTEEEYLVSSCHFENCQAQKEGGGVYCWKRLNILIGNTFKNCRPNNCGGECSCKPLKFPFLKNLLLKDFPLPHKGALR